MKEFIDEFKHLEKLCNEIYGDQHGVTLYIQDMESKSYMSTRGIEDWDRDLKYLTRVRHIRNNLVHESDYDIDYTEDDIAFMRDFYDRILNQEDPLSLLRKQMDQIKKVKPRPQPQPQPQPQVNQVVYQQYTNLENKENKEDSKVEKGLWIVIGVIVVAVIAALVVYAIKILF